MPPSDNDDSHERKLAAILAADVAGYSKLMADDELATVKALKEARRVFKDRIEAHSGRLIDTAGDSVLAEFKSVVEAVQCAVEVQEKLEAGNAPVPEHRKMHFRIGINLGDVIEEDDGTIYGDGVNVAARLEGLAAPGGVMLSDFARLAVEGKLDAGLEAAGEHAVKNIERPVRAWRVVVDGAEGVRPPAKTLRRPKVIASLAAALAIILGIAVWGVTVRVEVPQMVKADGTPTDDPVLAMPTGPSVAVLPFSNLSGDREQDFFADGITAEVISRLAEFNDLFIYSQGATYSYKNTELGAQEIGRELEARFVLTGSIRRSKDTVRIDVELLDSDSGQHLWSETYDRDLTAAGILEIQDEIGDGVAAVLGGTFGILTRVELAGLAEYQPKQLDSYECVLLARHYMNVASLELAKDTESCLERVVGDDPRYADAWGWLSYIYMDVMQFWSPDDPSYYDKALNAAQQAIALDVTHQRAHLVKNILQFHRRDCAAFLSDAKDTLRINPNNHEVVLDIALRAAGCGDWDYAVALVEKQITMVPHPIPFLYGILSWYEYRNRNYDAALEYGYKAELTDFYWSYIHQAVALARLDRMDEAGIAVDKILELYPDYQDRVRSDLESWFFAQPHLVEHWLDGLEMAGLFDEPETLSRPVIAVLPFDNMSGDPDQEYFADGITEDIITELSRFSDLSVISRTSTFQFKGSAKDIRVIAEELGASLVIEGSVRAGGGKVRVTAQLLDGAEGTHLWAETYNRELTAKNLFDVQDEITQEVVATIASDYGVLFREGQRLAQSKSTDSLAAYECVLLSKAYLENENEERHLEIRTCLEKAIELDPDYADAWAMLSEIYAQEEQFGFNPLPNSQERAFRAAKTAVELEPNNQVARRALATTYSYMGETEKFLAEAERAIALNPNNADVKGWLGAYIAWTGHWDEGVALMKEAMEMNPLHPSWWYFPLALRDYVRGDYEDSLESVNKIGLPDYIYQLMLEGALYGQLGRFEDAKRTVGTILELHPDFTTETVFERYRPYRFPEDDISKIAEGLRKAGVPEGDPPPTN